MEKHILSVLVENKAGVLTKVSGLFSRRGFNIDSLAVGVTEKPDVSRITILATGDARTIEQLTKQLNKLIDVIKVKRLCSEEVVCRELAMIKVRGIDVQKRLEIIQIANIFRAQVVDVSKTTVTIEMTGASDKVNAFLDMAEEFGNVELVRTGTIAIERGTQTISNK